MYPVVAGYLSLVTGLEKSQVFVFERVPGKNVAKTCFNLQYGLALMYFGSMKSYRDLKIYRESKALAVEIHKLSLTLPRFELYEEGSQIRRSSKGVTASIVEGYGRRRYKGDFIKYMIFSIAECDETIIHLDFLVETGSAGNKILCDEIRSRYDLLSRRINKFIHWAEENLNDFPETQT